MSHLPGSVDQQQYQTRNEQESQHLRRCREIGITYPTDLDELRKDLEVMKSQGNSAFKAEKHAEALTFYEKALKISQQSNYLYKEAAIVYSNQANVYFTLKNYKEALANAMAAISRDSAYHKGHWWNAKVLLTTGPIHDAFCAYVDGYIKSEVSSNTKFNFIMEALTLLKDIPSEHFIHCYNKLSSLDLDIWPQVLVRLNESIEWKCIAYLILGPDLKKERFVKKVTVDSIEDYCAGVAGRASTVPMQTYTIFQYLDRCDPKKEGPWLDAILFAVYYHGKSQTLKCLVVDEDGCPLHAAVRFALRTGRTYFIETFAGKEHNNDGRIINGKGDSVFHCITKFHPPPQADILCKVIEIMKKKDFSVMARDVSGKLAVDYLDDKYPGDVFDIFFEATKKNISKKPQQKRKYFNKSRTQPLSEVGQANKLTAQSPPNRACDHYDDLYSQGVIHFSNFELREGYEKMTELLQQKDKGVEHEQVMKKALAEIIKKLGETHNPEIPKCLTSIGREIYLMIMDGLASSNKWRQLDMVVRKYRQLHGSDQLKGFASNLTVVPVVRETSLKAAEDVKLQIVTNFLNSGGCLGTDNGQKAVRSACMEKHFKVLTELVKRGADTSNLSMYDGDTPMHAALTIALEKKSSVLLEIMLEQFENFPESYPHLDPKQLDKNEDCLFDLIVKAKFSSFALKLTEMLFKKSLCANYYNKDDKLPLDYISKKTDKRVWYLRLTRTVKQPRKQIYGPKNSEKENSSVQITIDDKLHKMPRPADREVYKTPITVSGRERRKRNIKDLIRLLPDSQHSIFKVENSSSKRTVVESESDETRDMVADIRPGKTPKRNCMLVDIESDDYSARKGTNEITNGNVINDVFEGADQQMGSDLGPPSLEKDVAVHTLNSSYSTTDESIDEFVDAQEPPDETEIEVQSVCNGNIEGKTKENHGSESDGRPNEVSVNENQNKTEREEKSVNNKDLEDTRKEYQTVEHGVNCHVQMKLEEENEIKKQEIKEVVQEGVYDEAEMSEGGDDRVQDDTGTDDDHIETEESGDEEEMKDEVDFEINVQVFDNLEWEVECTAEVWKTLRDKHVQPELKRRIVKKIQLLARGNWQPNLCKKLKNVPQSLNLFEAKFTKGSRILWELAKAFSPRYSETAERPLKITSGEITQPVFGARIYSEIIRVWKIVLDHDKIHRCVQRIKKSHQRGETCTIQKNLRAMRADLQQGSGAGMRFPVLYAEEITDQELERHHEVIEKYYPPASSNDTEYHILKFYSFSSNLVSHILQNIETKVDFPFRVTDLEHAIINLKSKAPILLLGRSGTGKTTCCLYRLWSQFHSYWYKAKKANAPLLPRCVKFVQKEYNGTASDEESGDWGDLSADDDGTKGASGFASAAAASCSFSDQEPAEENMSGVQLDHLHQLFITKNAVLSNKVQKNFRELRRADELLRNHVKHEKEMLPNRLQDVQEYLFPLFLTSRQLLLMLDASIGPPYFFERNEDGALKVDIAGWTDLDGPLSFLPLLDDSDGEDEIEQDVEDKEEQVRGAGQNTADKRLKLDPRREITYVVFVEEVWPRITKKKGKYHPSLIWMEIMSFIKGSYEALSKPCGYLTKDEYIKLGRKRAPNFTEERDSIYTFFVYYEHFKKHNSLFDETDLIHDAFCRMRLLDKRPWVVHQIFVDETQDFTQAELSLLIRLCQNPNHMFLTGDTAQSIMRGISFRFRDLKSLFYHAKKSMQAISKTSVVEVPKQVYQLTHNYRSHAGILSLAASVIELMVEFFPESFDRLNPDQGLFPGPQPILLESCSFSDLAVLLRGNRRKTSRIEFGAHQAILVVNDTARDSIPAELRLGLVLTIYEAKGLEFDDVLLYNFFKDSQAWTEWRVVTNFVERLAAQKKAKVTEYHDNLVQIDQDILAAAGRPRPLNFDPNMHKVLNSELKHLYTALTRARVNVWIFDEDMDKRAPMFEYFKVRQLVKCMRVKEINEAKTVFAEKSSPADWLKEGEGFMRHSLYRVAAQCFGMGGDHDKEKVALAHEQALQACRLKEVPRQMRDEFLYAAELYMECNRLTEAAICLQNAKETELAAGLFEKLGQYERAAEMYRKLKKSRASSRCYERIGNYNKAVEVLYESEDFDTAIDTLRRYHMLIKKLHQKRSPIPPQLVANKPAACYTEEKLNHRIADMFHRYSNVEKMLEAVDSFVNINDKVEFLKNKNYIPHAAKILEEDGQLVNAANLLLMYGLFDEANTMAKKTLKDEVIAHCLLVTCRGIMSKKDMIEDNVEFLQKSLKEAFRIFQSCNDNDQFGQVNLLQAQMSGNVESIKFGWKAFHASTPFPNEAGLVECADWLVKYGDLGNLYILQAAVCGLECLFGACHVMLDPNTQTNRERVQKYDQFYGLGILSQDKVVIHTKEKPLCMGMIKGIFKTKSKAKKTALQIQKTEVYEAIVIYLLNRSKAWLKPIQNALNKMREKTRVCDYFQAGIECPYIGDVDKPCRYLHSVETRETFQKLIELDLLMMEYEGSIHGDAVSLRKKCPPAVKPIVNDYLWAKNADPYIKYQACIQLWNDLMPAAGHSLLVGSGSKLLLEYIRMNDKVVSHFKRFLLEKWRLFTTGEKKLRSDAARQTEVYLLFEFGYHLFGYDTGRRKFKHSPIEEMTKLERLFDNEVAARPNYVRSKRKYTLMMSEDKFRSTKVTCVARRFTDAYHLISKGELFESMMTFSEFQVQLSNRRTTDYNFYPDMKTYLMWLEFYTCLAIFLISKLKTENFPDFVFVLPSNYFALVQFVEATFPNSGNSVQDLVGCWMPSYKKQKSTENLIYQRLKGFAFVVSGHEQGFPILDQILQKCIDDSCYYSLLERLLILNMTMVCNVGNSVAPESEISLMSSMTHIALPERTPKRIQHTLYSIKNCKGIAGVAIVLRRLLSERGQKEELLVCKWKNGKKQTIEKTELENINLFEDSFLNELTFQDMHATNYREHVSHEEAPVEDDLDEEDIERGIIGKEEQLMKKKMDLAVLYVQRIFRAKRELRQLRKEKSNRGSTNNVDSMFEEIKVDENMCGICGFFFVSKLEERSELEMSTFIRGISVLTKKPAVFEPLRTQDQRQRAQDETQIELESSQYNPLELQLETIRTQHMQENSHIQMAMELNTFRKKYKQVIAPTLKTVNSFLNNAEYGLMNQEHVVKNYAREQMVIERMKRNSTQIEKNVQLLMKNRSWSTTAGCIEQKVKELETDFHVVKAYVNETYTYLTQEKEEWSRQVMASSSAGENVDDEFDDIEDLWLHQRQDQP